jgi:membrane protease YdiL (CAAX protease family)
MRKINRLTLFLILTFVISFSLAGLYKLSGGQYDKAGGTILAVVYMFVPMVSAIIVEKGIHKENLKSNIRISFKINKWFFAGWLMPPALSFCSLGVSLLFPGVTYDPEMTGMLKRFGNMFTPEEIDHMKAAMKALPIHPLWLSLVQGLIAGATINAVAGFGEELGWRGFLLKEFKGTQFLKASVIIGFIWGIWHAPLILMGHNYPQHPEAGVLMMTIWYIFLTPLFLYIAIKSKSVIAAAIM